MHLEEVEPTATEQRKPEQLLCAGHVDHVSDTYRITSSHPLPKMRAYKHTRNLDGRDSRRNGCAQGTFACLLCDLGCVC
jgi:hypothetical protein